MWSRLLSRIEILAKKQGEEKFVGWRGCRQEVDRGANQILTVGDERKEGFIVSK